MRQSDLCGRLKWCGGPPPPPLQVSLGEPPAEPLLTPNSDGEQVLPPAFPEDTSGDSADESTTGTDGKYPSEEDEDVGTSTVTTGGSTGSEITEGLTESGITEGTLTPTVTEESQTTASETVPDGSRRAFAPLQAEPPADPRPYVLFNAYYIQYDNALASEKGPYQLSLIGDKKPTAQSVKYQLEFHNDISLEIGEVEIKMPFSLYTDRQGQAVKPAAIGVPQAPYESQVSPFNYSISDDGQFLVFSNVRPISAGTNNLIQVLYRLDDMQTRDGSRWNLKPAVKVQGHDLSDLTPLTGSMHTEVKLSTVEKRAYSDSNQFYPELYTWDQVLGVLHKSTAKYPQPSDFDDYKYVLWQTRVELSASQPWTLTVEDQADSGLDGQVVGYVRYNENPQLNWGYIDTQWGTTYTLNEQSSYGLSTQNARGYIYTVVRYPKEKIQAGSTEISNTIEVTAVGVDDPTAQTTLSSTAKHVWVDYQWDYSGDTFDVKKTYDYSKEDTETGYYSVLSKKVDAGTDMELPRSWNISAHLQGYKLSQEGQKSYTVILVDDLLYVKSKQDSYQLMGPEDYYYQQIHFELDERLIDKYENQTQPVSDGEPVLIKVQTADQPGAWQEVDTVPFTALSSYQVPGTWIRRGIYRICAEHSSRSYSCGLTISARTVLRASSSKLRTYVNNPEVNALTLFNLGGGYTLNPERENQYYETSSGALPEYVKDYDQKTYGGPLYRAAATVTLNSVPGRNIMQKFVNTSQDPIHGRVNMDYVLLAAEGYSIYSQGVDYLESLGFKVGRKQVHFYDLLPLGMKFNPQVPVTVGSPDMYTPSKENSDSWNKDQYSVDYEVVDNYKESGRQLLRFRLTYNGEDGSRISGWDARDWYQSWGLRFGAFYSWNDYSTANEASNVAAFDTVDEMIGKSFTDDGYGQPDGAATDPELLKDMDGNGEISKFGHLIYATAAHSDDLTLAAKSGIEKFVKSDADSFMVPQKEASVEVGKGYTYTLQVHAVEGSQAKDIVIFDHLEEALNDSKTSGQIDGEITSWKGNFVGLDLSVLKLKGIAPKVYYSDLESAPHDLKNSAWTLSNQWPQEKLSEVKSLAIDISEGNDGQEFILKGGQSISFGVHMTAPVNMPTAPHALNLASFRSRQSAADGSSWREPNEVKSDPTKVSLFAAASLSIEKKLAENTPENVKDESFAFSVSLKGRPLADKEYELFVGEDKLPGIYATDADGELFLKAGQKARFPSMPAGAEYEVTELTGYQWKCDIEKTQSGTLEGGKENSLCYTNTYQPILYFEKRLKYAQDYTNSGDEFSFVLKLNDQPAGGHEYYLFTADEAKTREIALPPDISGKTALTTAADGSFQLKAGERAAFALPPNSFYSVQETTLPEDYNQEVQRTVTGQLATENALASLSNEYLYKDLFIKKTVRHAEGVALPDETFSFELKLNGQPAAGAEYILYGPDPQHPGQMREIERDQILPPDGKFTLKDGQEIRLIKLPTGASYEIRESLTEEQQKNYRMSAENASGKLPLYAPFVKASFNNQYLIKNLEVSKTVIAPTDKDKSQAFTFVVTKNGQALTNTHYRLFEGETEVLEGSRSTDGEGKFTLKHGQRAFLPGFREGNSYTVREEKADGYTQVAPKDLEGFSGTVDPSLQNMKAAFSNLNEAYKDVLIFSKHFEMDEYLLQKISGADIKVLQEDLNNLTELEFKFQILVDDKPLVDKSYIRIDPEGNEHPGTTREMDHRQGCFTLKANEKAIFKDISEGRYRIQELFPELKDHYFNLRYYYTYDPNVRDPFVGRWEVKEAPQAEAVEYLISDAGIHQMEMTNLLKYDDIEIDNFIYLYKFVNDDLIDRNKVKNTRISFHATFYDKDGQEVKVNKGLKWYDKSPSYKYLDNHEFPAQLLGESDEDGNIEIDFSKIQIPRLYHSDKYIVKLDECLPPGHPAGELSWIYIDNGTIATEAYIYNTTQRADLKVEKKVQNEEEADKSFGFTIERRQPVTVNDTDEYDDEGHNIPSYQVDFVPYDHVPFIRYRTAGDAPVTGQPEMTDEQGRFTLRNGEYALFNVPVDDDVDGEAYELINYFNFDPRLRFRVTEEAYSDYASQITYHKEDGTEQIFSGNRVEMMGREKATFTNTHEETAGLSVSKTVTREEGQSAPNPDQSFRFKLEVNGKTWKNKNYRLYDPSGKEIENKKDINGVDVIKPWTTDNLGCFSLKDGERAVFDWIGAGKNYEITELPAEGFVQTVPAEGHSLSGVIPQKGDVLGFTNMYKNPERRGELIVRKQLQLPAGISDYPEESFDFKVEISGKPFASRNYDLYSEDGSCLEKDKQTDSEGKFSLHGKQYAVFKDVPPNLDYKVSEIDKKGSLYQPLGEYIKEGFTTKASTDLCFVNGLSSLWVSKEVTNHSRQKLDSNEDFSFILTLNGRAAGGQTYWLYDKDLKKIDEGSCAADGSFTLKADESAIFFGIPAGTAYTLKESPKEKFSQILPVNPEGYRGKIDYSANKLIFVNNYAPLPGLWLSKQVIDKNSHSVADSRSFSFRLSHGGRQPLAWTNYRLYATDGSLKPELYQTNKEGVLQLRSGEKAYFEGLEAGDYQAEELNVPTVYTPVEQKKSISLRSGSEDIRLSFVNKIDSPEMIYGSLVITNTIRPSGDKQRFHYILTLSDPGIQGLQGTLYEGGLKGAEIHPDAAEAKALGQLSFVDGKAEFELSDSQWVELRGLLAGTDYEVQEIENEDYRTTVQGQPGFSCKGSIFANKTAQVDYVNERVVPPSPEDGIFRPFKPDIVQATCPPPQTISQTTAIPGKRLYHLPRTGDGVNPVWSSLFGALLLLLGLNLLRRKA